MPWPDKQEPVVFDLVDENGLDGSTDAVGGGPGTPPEPPQRFLVRLSRVSRRTWLVVAAAVTVTAVTLAAVDLVRDDMRQELMRTSSVGVASLADPPTETWSVPFDTTAGQGQDLPMDQQVVTMGGLLVVPPAHAQSYRVAPSGPGEPVLPGFEDVVALDPGSGEVAWRVPLGERPTCGPTGYDASTSTEVLVCVQGPDDAREVLAIAADGSTRARPVDLAEGEQVFPGPGGLAVRTVRTGEPRSMLTCDVASGECAPEGMAGGRDLLVTAEDAGTGVERWTSTVEFDPMSSTNCQAPSEPGDWTTVDSAMDPDVVTVSPGAETVVVDGCGVSATLSVPGTRLDLAGDAAVTAPAWVTELGSGRFAVQGKGPGTTVVDETGTTLHTLDGWVRNDAASPDAPDDLWFVTMWTNGSGFEAVRADGSVAWTERHGRSALLAGRDVVVVDRGNRVVGRDRESGAELWTWSGGDLSELVRFRTLTDGEAVALEYVSRDGSTRAGLLVAIDLDTGKELWDVPMTGPAVAVDGHLVEFTPDGVRGLG